MPIEVSLDITKVPAVTVNPDQHHFNKVKGEVEWKPAAQQNFAFSNLEILPPPAKPPSPSPFGKPVILKDSITVSDDPSGKPPGEIYEYVVYVIDNATGKPYNSLNDGPGGGNGNPSIKNN